VATCAFSNGFSNGFEVCAPVVVEPVTGPLLGVPRHIVTRRRRLRPVPLEGRAAIAVLGRGALSVEQGIFATLLITFESQGLLSLVQALAAFLRLGFTNAGRRARLRAGVSLGGDLPLPLGVTADLSVIVFKYVPALIELAGAPLAVAVLAFGRLRHGLAFAGDASLPVQMTASVVAAGRSLAGEAPLYPLAFGNMEADDEETALALLGLPSEVLA